MPNTPILQRETDDHVPAGLGELPHTWSLIPPHSSPTGHTQLLISSLTTPSLLLLDSLECVDQRLSKGPFMHISPSANGKYIALLTYNNLLWVVSSDFSRSLVEWDCGANEFLKEGVRQVKWCGNDAVLVSSVGGASVLVGPAGDTLAYDQIALFIPNSLSPIVSYHPRPFISRQNQMVSA
jgi:hypothetical protein